MRRLAALLLPLALGACTGTFEIRPPILLVVAFEDGTPQLALIRDNFATEAAPVPRELVFVESSRRDLPAPAVAFDVVDRAGERPTLLVLGRTRSAPFTAYLRGFDLTGVDAGAPDAFAEDATFARDLTAVLRDQPELADDADYCLVDLQISASGRYLALLEDRSACGSDEFEALYLLDLQNDRLVAAIDTKELVAAGLYLDQRSNQLYFVAEGVGSSALERLEVTSGGGGVVADLGGREQVDLARVAPPAGSDVGDALVALSAGAFQVIDTAATPAEVAPPVDTTSGSRSLLHDPFEISELVLVLGSSRFTVHRTFEEEGRSVSVSAVAGTFQPQDLFVYLVGPQRVYIYDALIDEGTGTPRLAAFEVAELISPGPVTWLRGVESGP